MCQSSFPREADMRVIRVESCDLILENLKGNKTFNTVQKQFLNGMLLMIKILITFL